MEAIDGIVFKLGGKPSRSPIPSLLLLLVLVIGSSPSVLAVPLALMGTHTFKPLHNPLYTTHSRKRAGRTVKVAPISSTRLSHESNKGKIIKTREKRSPVNLRRQNTAVHKATLNRKHKGHAKRTKGGKIVLYKPQDYLPKLHARVIAPGLVFKSVTGPLAINVLDVACGSNQVKVRPILAGDAFNCLRDVSAHARESHALAAINANYFKRDGVPLGTLIVDGQWVTGPLYDRVSLGITDDGRVRIDRVELGGILTTSNLKMQELWVNNINQPRRTGSRLIAYTRRWGDCVRLAYPGCLVAINAQGEVLDKGTNVMGIPWGGYVLSDSRISELANLERGDITHLSWSIHPTDWQDVVEAVSGGPLLVKDGKLFVDLKDENFKAGWTSGQIKARTAAGVTANGHLLLVTVEGPHTLWDLAKFLKMLGATDALNLDGGGSTTMVVNGRTVTRARESSERRVASAIGVFPANMSNLSSHARLVTYTPRMNLVDFNNLGN